MQDNNKIEEIRCLLQNLEARNESYSDAKFGTYYDYDRVVGLLKQADEIINSSARTLRPSSLPEKMPWKETFADSDEEFNPYVYDGSMSLEDSEKMVDNFEADRKNGLVDEHGEPIEPPSKDFKIRFFATKGNYVEETLPFNESELVEKIAAATKKVDGDKNLEGWTVSKLERDIFLNLKRQPPTWTDYRPGGGLALYYDTGRRGGYISHDAIYIPPELHTSPMMP